MINVLKTLYNINILLTLAIICYCTFKDEGLMLQASSWEQLLAPLYFFMTEMLLVAIVSFVVLVNSVIQLCCNSSSRASRLIKSYNMRNAQESNIIISDPSALVRVSVWFLYVSVCGLLCLFLLLKNASNLDSPTDNSSTTSTSQPNLYTNLPGYLKGNANDTQTVIMPPTSSGDSPSDLYYNILVNQGHLIILYFGGIIVLTLIFYTSLK